MIDFVLDGLPELVIRHLRAIAGEGAELFGDRTEMIRRIPQGEVHVASMKRAVLLRYRILRRHSTVSHLFPSHRGQFGMLRRSLRIGVERDAGLFNLHGAGPPYRRVVGERMIEIRPAELRHQRPERLPLRWGKNVGPVLHEITPWCRQPLTEHFLSVIHLVDVGWRTQDAYIGQNIAQPNMRGFQPVERFFPVRRFLQIEVACFGNPLQILCQPLALQCGIACPLPQARGHSLGIDARALQRLGQL